MFVPRMGVLGVLLLILSEARVEQDLGVLTSPDSDHMPTVDSRIFLSHLGLTFQLPA